VTAQPHAHVRFRRAIERRAAEDAARELPNLPLEDALRLVHLYAERGSPKFEPAARRWLVRYLTEGTPSLRDVAKVIAANSPGLDEGAVELDRTQWAPARGDKASCPSWIRPQVSIDTLWT
jgi:hypothetical protein